VSFATNDERTAKRISDALGTATEMKAMKNYAGHRLSPWLGHLMVSRSETARALLTPGEVMQLPSNEEIVMVAGISPIRASKARYYADRRLSQRILPPPKPFTAAPGTRPADDWTRLRSIAPVAAPAQQAASFGEEADDQANAGIRREPELPEHGEMVPTMTPTRHEFDFDDSDASEESTRNLVLRERMVGTARQASLDPDDGVEL
jgi:type IV secretion system protein VirD4